MLFTVTAYSCRHVLSRQHPAFTSTTDTQHQEKSPFCFVRPCFAWTCQFDLPVDASVDLCISVWWCYYCLKSTKVFSRHFSPCATKCSIFCLYYICVSLLDWLPPRTLASILEFCTFDHILAQMTSPDGLQEPMHRSDLGFCDPRAAHTTISTYSHPEVHKAT